MIIHAIGAVFALFLVLYAAVAWAARGFPISVGHYVVPYDDGSFWALVIGLFFLVYCPVAVAAAARDARDATHSEDETPTI